MQTAIYAFSALGAIGALAVSILLHYNKQTIACWATFATICSIALAVCLFWQKTIDDKTSNGDKETASKQNEIYNNLPLFDFIVQKKCQDTEQKYCDEHIYIKNVGSGQALNLHLNKFPGPDNRQMVGLSGQQKRINNNRSKNIAILGINEEKFFYSEREYNGKNVKIIVRFKNISNTLFEYTYSGSHKDLNLIEKKYIDKNTMKHVLF